MANEDTPDLDSFQMDRRIRARIIECLEMITSEGVGSIGPDGWINLWDDFVPNSSPSEFPEPVYSIDEARAIQRVGAAVDHLAKVTANPMPPLEELLSHPAWRSLIDVAQLALVILKRPDQDVVSDPED